jgi:MFS family permease
MSGRRIAVVAVAFVTLLVTSGVNLSFGLFLAPLAREFGASRAAVSFAATTNLLLLGVAQPFFGRLIDAFGPRRVLTIGIASMALAVLATGQATALWQLYLSYGVLGGIGFTGAGILTVSVLVLRWFRRSRGTALTVIATGSSLGQAVFYQAASWLIATGGWRTTCSIFGVLLAVLVPICFWLVRDDPPGDTAAEPAATSARDTDTTGLADVVTRPTFRLLAGAYLACGFTDFMITTHLAVLAVDRGLGAMTGARALSLLAVANVAGLLLAGRLADRTSNRFTLVVVYAVRALALTLLPFVGGRTGLFTFAVVFGLTFFTTAPLTSSLVNELYGLRLTGRVFGMANLIHHLAGAAGAYLAGEAFDLTGSYLPVFLLGAAFVYLATFLTSRIEVPRTRRAWTPRP